MINYVVIACGRQKREGAHKASELYTGASFRLALSAAKSSSFDGAAVLVLSAKHGLVNLDTVLTAYDVTFGQPGAIGWDRVSVQAARLGIGHGSNICLLPRAYLDVIRKAANCANVINVFEGASGIGYQRRILSRLAKEEVPS